MRKIVISMTVFGCLLTSISGFGQMGMMNDRSRMDDRGMMGGGMMNMSMIRHHFVMRNGIDPAYASKENPLRPIEENVIKGKKLFDQNCAACHGSSGLGDGDAGKSLNPRPTNIAAFSKMPMATDGYLFWTITEGGIPLGTAMPAFKSTLKEEDIWQIILYLREL